MAAVVAVLAGVLPPDQAWSSEADDHLDLSLDELVNATVSTASKFAQKTIDAPAAVSIITADEIELFGYETLGELLGSVRGMYATYDRNYAYLGIRGIGRTSNFNNRFLLLIDGFRVNDTFYENAALGRDQLVDIDLIDRVEIVRGPGSSVYGSNAFFGVINVITKRGADIGGVEMAAKADTFESYDQRLTYGSSFANGAELLLSAARYDSEGQDRFVFTDADFQIPEKNFGVVDGRDRESAANLNLKFSIGGFTLTAAYVDRWKEVPTASFGSVINQPHETIDTKSTLGLDYQRALTDELVLAVRAYASRYDFERRSYYDRINEDLPPFTLNIEDSAARWWGSEVQLSWTHDRHHIVAGAELQNSWKLDHAVFDVQPFDPLVESRSDRQTLAAYVQDEIRLADALLFNAGIRYDDYSNFGSTVNPRLALIYSPKATTAVKLLYGTAFRAPSEFELNGGADRISNPALQPEEIETGEVVVEHYLAPDFRIIGSLYRNELKNLSELVDDPVADMLVFRNSGRARTTGAEVEVERIWPGSRRLRASYAWQRTVDGASDRQPANSPRNEVKLKYSAPFFAEFLHAGMEVQYLSERHTLLTGTFDEDFPGFIYGPAGSYLSANLSALTRLFDDRLTIALDVNNLLDERIEDPAGRENDQNLILQDGRMIRLTVTYRFDRR